jgi:hypothetical protein
VNDPAKHLDKAFASLDDLAARELEAAAEAIASRRHPLHAFSSIFRGVADAREGGWDSRLPRWHLQQSIESADDEFVAKIEGATAPFWRHVREAILANREEAANERLQLQDHEEPHARRPHPHIAWLGKG